MKREDILFYIMIFFIIGIILKLYFDSEAFHLKCIISDVNGKTYCVRERAKLELAADLLARAGENMQKLVDHMHKTYPDRDNVKRLKNKFNADKISEILPTSKHTAYSENKGEKLRFCVTTERESDTLIDENTLTFVAIHELSHISSKTIGHNNEFWDNFTFLLKNAVQIGIYVPEDYKKKPKQYCGMKITDNPYYNK